MADLDLFSTDHGQTIRVNTFYSGIGSATSIKIKFKKLGATDTADLSASIVSGDTTTYAVQATVTDDWLDDKAGDWIGQVEATFSDAVLTGTTFVLRIEAVPTA